MHDSFLIALLCLLIVAIAMLGVVIYLLSTRTYVSAPVYSPQDGAELVTMASLERVLSLVIKGYTGETGEMTAEGRSEGGNQAQNRRATVNPTPFYAVEEPDDRDMTDIYLPNRREEAVVVGDSYDDDNPFGIEGLTVPQFPTRN